MSDARPGRTRPSLDLETVSQGRRAAYRRVLGVLKAHSIPFVVAGPVGLALYSGSFEGGDLELLVPSGSAPLTRSVLEASGFRLSVDENRGEAVVDYADHVVRIAWRLPAPLGGQVDDAWFSHATRGYLLGLRARFAPLEELLWVRISAPGAQSLADPLITTMLAAQGERLAWDRMLIRLAGMEALFLAHLFLLHHAHPEAARARTPPGLIATLLGRLNSGGFESVETSTH